MIDKTWLNEFTDTELPPDEAKTVRFLNGSVIEFIGAPCVLEYEGSNIGLLYYDVEKD